MNKKLSKQISSSLLSAIFPLFLIFLSASGCSSGKKDFMMLPEDGSTHSSGQSDAYDVLDDYPALDDSFSNVDPVEFNDILDELVNTIPDETNDVFNHLMPLIVTDDGNKGPLLISLNRMTDTLGVVINQNDYDTESTDYASGFYSFFDALGATDIELSPHIFPIARKTLSYLVDTYDSVTLDSVVQDLENMLSDTGGVQTFRDVFNDISEGLGKLLVRANIFESGSIKAGNAVSGVDQLFSALNSFSQAPEGRQKVYNILRELGELTAVSVPTTDPAYPSGKKYLKDILRNFVTGSAGLFIGGSSYNPGANYKSASPYVNAELKNSLKEIYPPLVQLFLRSDRPDSIIKNEGNGVYPLEAVGKDLKRLNLNLGAMDLDTALYDMVRYDGFGKDRLLNTNANNMSYIEHLLYTVLTANYTGFLTRGSTSGEPSSNHDRGHGTATGGILTMNDCLYSMGNGTHSAPLGMGDFDAYNLALNIRVEQSMNTLRSSSPFNYTQRSSHNFYLGYDFPALGLLSGNGAGDAGIPNGGETAVRPTSDATTAGTNNDFRTYFPEVSDGIGELNTTRWVMGWIVRACWKGEGPYYSAEGATDNGNGTYTYYSPDGKVYATVDKSSSNWVYHYPSGEHYKASWHTDYYLQRANKHNDIRLDDDKRYFAPNRVYGTSGDDRFRMARKGYDSEWDWGCFCIKKYPRTAPTQNAGALTYQEDISENNHSRVCATQEEAMFKNYQWLMGEKKFVFVIPMMVHADVCSVQIFSPIYVVVEANGILGITNARKGPGNNKWVIKGNEGLDIHRTHGVSDRNGNTAINYGDSNEWGDARITIIIKEDHDDMLGIGDDVDISVIWNQILQSGRMLPNVVGVNFGPIQRMAFVKNEGALPSSQAGIGGAQWNNRNTLFPVIVALLGELHDRTQYTNGSGHNYNYSSSNKYPLKVATDGLLPPLAKPLFRRFTDSGGRWVPRISANGQSETSSRYLARGQSDSFYKIRTDLYTTLGMLSESGKKRCDGLVPAIAKTKLVSRIVELLQYYGDSAYDDPPGFSENDFSTWGARRKLFYGLEQIVTSIRTSKGDAIQKGYTGLSYPSWIFAKHDRLLDLDHILNEGLGTYEANGSGIAGVVYRRNQSGNWTNYNRFMDALPQLLSSGGQYTVMEDAISLLDTLAGSMNATDEELRGVRHALGTLLYRYNSSSGQWTAGNELTEIFATDFPAICDTYRVKGGSIANLLTFTQELIREDGFIPYMTSQLAMTDSAENLMGDMYNLMTSPMFSEPNSFWYDFVNLLNASASQSYQVNAAAAGTYPNVLFGNVSSTQYNPYSGLSGYDPVTGSVDKYLIFGELLSKEGIPIINR